MAIAQIATSVPFTLEIYMSPPDRAWVSLYGRLDSAAAPILAQHLAMLADEGIKQITIDLAELDSLEPPGLGLILEEHMRMIRAGGSLDIFCPPRQLQRLFALKVPRHDSISIQPKSWATDRAS